MNSVCLSVSEKKQTEVSMSSVLKWYTEVKDDIRLILTPLTDCTLGEGKGVDSLSWCYRDTSTLTVSMDHWVSNSAGTSTSSDNERKPTHTCSDHLDSGCTWLLAHRKVQTVTRASFTILQVTHRLLSWNLHTIVKVICSITGSKLTSSEVKVNVTWESGVIYCSVAMLVHPSKSKQS